ncbi:MAG: peptidase domain-containing ABC transporter [Pseudomonadota bacterium]
MSSILSPLWKRRVRPVLQSESSECALACLAMVADYHGDQRGLSVLRQRFPGSARGIGLPNLLALADSLGLSARALRTSLAELGSLQLPCILHWNFSHFVVLESVTNKGATICDPAYGRRHLQQTEVSKAYTGVAVELATHTRFRQSEKPQSLRLLDLLRAARTLLRPLARVLIMSFVLQLIALLLPLYSQWVIDEVVVRGDHKLMDLLLIGFSVLTLFGATLNVLRGWLLQSLGAQLRYAWQGGLQEHLLRLPLDWFQKRSAGGIQSRFNSMRSIQQSLTQSAPEILVDGVLALSILFVIVVYAPNLSVLTFGFVGIYALVRIAMMPLLHARTQAAIASDAAAETHFLESTRAALTIKSLGAEALRSRGYRNVLVHAINAGLATGRLVVLQGGLNQLVFGMQNLLVIWIAAEQIIAGTLTVGMLIAFLAYQSQFVQRATALVDRLLELRLLRVHLQRVADVALSEPETDATGNFSLGLRPRPRSGPAQLQLDKLWFRYGSTEPYVIRELTLCVAPGEHVALSGPSGCGKTSLLKLMMGLITPERGTVLCDGRELRGAARLQCRQEIAAVMQDDHLLSGSILDNICGLSDSPERDWARRCAQFAAIEASIDAMPMGFETPVGDLGSALSGGQVQRLLLARALYRKPRLLFLDEASSHLDGKAQALIFESLRKFPMSIVSIAHRQETLAFADRVVSLPELQRL